MSEVNFHKSRIAFAIINDKLIYLKNSELSHIDWLVPTIVKPEEFKYIIRGYVKDNNIIFYIGDFCTNKEVELKSLQYAPLIKEDLSINNSIELYCGVVKGKIGEVWRPYKLVGKI